MASWGASLKAKLMSKNELYSRVSPVHEDMRMQQRVWTFERVGWYALVIIVLPRRSAPMASCACSTSG
jgi:hypothetical protein